MLNIVKNVNNMHKILSSTLPKESVEIIFRDIFRDLTKNFEEFYGKLNLQTKYGKKRIKVDLKYF